jgi:LDH2 family malate/lactate/ureidoglycolate dehydrogenase
MTEAASPDLRQRFPAARLRAFTREALAACGLPSDDAAVVADAIVEADLTGVDTHGITRLPQYVPVLQEGRINPRPNITIDRRGPATALVDGDNGMGHLVMTFAARSAMAIALDAGVGWVGVRRSNHAGAGGVYATIPLEQNLIGIYAATSGVNVMAPSGGAEPLLGTNPIAFAIPAGDEAPVVLDIATSVSSFGLIRQHAMEGKPIPEGWMIDRTTGEPITDPARTAGSLLLPIGGYKGSGLALVIGLLSGVLNSAAFGRDVSDVNTPDGAESNTGQFIMAVDVSRFTPIEQFKREVDRHIRDLRTSAALPGGGSVHVPGEGRRRKKEQRLRDGVELSPAVLKQLDDMARKLGLRSLRERE